jgi:hypothetical protein
MSYFNGTDVTAGVFGKIRRINPEFHLGYRNGIKHEIDNSRWDLNLVWTTYANSTDDRARLAAGQVFAAFLLNHSPNGPTATGANAHWHLNLNALDFEVGYNLGWKSRFGVRPFAGIKVAKIEQEVRVNYLNTLFGTTLAPSVFSRDHYTSHNYGLRFGVNTQFNTGGGFKIFLNAAFATLWSGFDLMHNENLRGSPKRAVYHQSIEDVIPEVELAAGIAWQTFFKKRQYFLDLRLGWEQQTWFSQNKNFNQSSMLPDQVETAEHNMSFAGPTFSATFGF